MACWWTSPSPTARPSPAPSSTSPGRTLTREHIQEYKNQGGWNDDWQLSHHIVRSTGVEATFEEVKAHFQAIFHGATVPRA